MRLDWASNPGPLGHDSDVLPTALHDPANRNSCKLIYQYFQKRGSGCLLEQEYLLGLIWYAK